MLKLRNSIGMKITLLVLCGASLVFALALAYSYSYSRRLILNEAEKSAKKPHFVCCTEDRTGLSGCRQGPRCIGGRIGNEQPRQGYLVALHSPHGRGREEVYGSTVAFEPHVFDEKLFGYAPYYYGNKSNIRFEQLGSDSYDYFTKDWYHVPKELKAPVWSEPYFDEGGGGVLMITCSRPFFKQGDHGTASKVRGIVTADVSLQWLTGILSSVHPGCTGYCFITSSTGRFVTHPDPELVMSESLFSLAEERHDPALRSIGQAMGKEESGFVTVGPALIGEAAFLAYAPIGSPGWSLGAVFPKKELLADMNHLHQATVLVAAGGLILLLMVSGLVSSVSLPGP